MEPQRFFKDAGKPDMANCSDHYLYFDDEKFILDRDFVRVINVNTSPDEEERSKYHFHIKIDRFQSNLYLNKL